MDIINVTKARNNLSKLISDVYRRKKKYVLIRDSIPQAVIVPYDEFQSKEEEWQTEVRVMMKEGKKQFKKYLAKQNKKWPKNEKQVYKILDKAAGRD